MMYLLQSGAGHVFREDELWTVATSVMRHGACSQFKWRVLASLHDGLLDLAVGMLFRSLVVQTGCTSCLMTDGSMVSI